MKTTESKILPYSTTKQGLYNMYADQFSYKSLSEKINQIIIDNRGLSLGSNPRVKIIRHLELQEFVEIYGMPKGYIGKNDSV